MASMFCVITRTTLVTTMPTVSSTSTHAMNQSSIFRLQHKLFLRQLLKQLTAQITFSACTFQSQAEVYNTIHGHCDQQRLSTFVSRFHRSNIHKHADGLDWRLNIARLEDGWFLHRLVLTFAELGLLNVTSKTCVGISSELQFPG